MLRRTAAAHGRDEGERMQRGVVIAMVLGLALTAAAIFWAFSGDETPKMAVALAEDKPEAAEKHTPNRVVGTGTPSARLPAVQRAAPAAKLPDLDCAKPSGEVLHIGARAVTAVDFCQELAALAGAPPQPLTPAWHEQARLLRKRLVDTELVRQALTKENQAVTDAEIDADLLPRLQKPGAVKLADLDLQRVRGQLRARLEINKLLTLRGQADVTEADLQAAYAAEPNRFGAAAVVKIATYSRSGFIGASEGAKWSEAQAKAHTQAFYDEVSTGARAEDAARSRGLQAKPAFELREGAGEPELFAAAMQATPGQWLPPQRSMIGWLVARVDAITPGKPLPLEQVRDKVRAVVTAQRGQLDEAALLAELEAAGQVVDSVTW